MYSMYLFIPFVSKLPDNNGCFRFRKFCSFFPTVHVGLQAPLCTIAKEEIMNCMN